MITFNSLNFLWFFIIVFSFYWLLPRKAKNATLLIASYIFYASWNIKFLGLILVSTLTDYFCGRAIHAAKSKFKRKLYLIISIVVNLSLLGFFKYFNFFTENLITLLNSLGLDLNFSLLNIILPVGISFYTFQTLSYTIDIYRKKMKPTKNIIDFSLFVAYFPQLVAGPIERAKNLIPKIEVKKHFREIQFKKGFYLFVYGLVKKVVIADTLSKVVSTIYASPDPTAASVLIGTYAFAIQIYCDFSGYSNMARGISYFFGIKLSTNFNLPYFAKNPSDFWKRWHITLSSWIKEYLYIPLGGNKAPIFGLTSLVLTMFLMGLWHGAEWNFALWGVYWAVLTIIYRILTKLLSYVKLPENKIFRMSSDFFLIIVMFHLTCYSWILFRSQSLEQVVTFTLALFANINFAEFLDYDYINLYVFGFFLFVYMILQHYHKDLLFMTKKDFVWQIPFYLVLFFLFIQAGEVVSFPFIYFQF